MAITVTVEGETFIVESYESSHMPGKPASSVIGVAVPTMFRRDMLESWLGKEATVTDDGPAPWSEARRIVRVRAEGRALTLWGQGASGGLLERPAFSVWTEASPAEVVEEILERAGIRAEVSLGSSAATAHLPYVLQHNATDWYVVQALARAYGFAIVDMADGGISVIDTPTGATHEVDPAMLAEDSVIHDVQLPVTEEWVATFEEDGTHELLEGRAAEAPPATAHEHPAARRGFVPSRDYLAALLEGSSKIGSLFGRSALVLPRGNLQVGDIVDSKAFPNTMAVVARRSTLDSRGMVSTIDLVDPSQFAAALAPRAADLHEGMAEVPAFTLATIAEPNLPEQPGWCSVVIPDAGNDTPLPAQLLAWGGGTEGGPSWLPAAEALVLVALLGDAIMPRLVVLGVCRNGANPPAATNAETCILRFGEEGGDGAMLELGAERIVLKADEIQLTASAIKMNKG